MSIHGIINQVFSDLLNKIVLNGFWKVDYDDEMNDANWGVGTSAACCLRALA